MRRRILVGLMGGIVMVLLGCSKAPPAKDEPQQAANLGAQDEPREPPALLRPKPRGDTAEPPPEPLPPPKHLGPTPAEDAPFGKEPQEGEAPSPLMNEKEAQEAALQANYDAALADGLKLLAERKLPAALEAFETARSFRDTDFIRDEIARLKLRIDQDAIARKTVNDIETVLDQGKAADAAQLAQAALREFGDSDYAPQLVKLKLQADALQAAQKEEDRGARQQRFRSEGDAALKENNLRAAALAFEQALAARDDIALRRRLDDVRGALDRYDGLRRKAAELRGDPNNLEDALAALQEAAQVWDTLQVRQEIDEYSLALQKRRDRVAVAEFEVRGNVGIGDAGRTIAEELLPHLKSRFDLVDRDAIHKIVTDLKLQGPPLDPEQQREIGQLAKARYLVVGSITPLGGLVVNARLIDTRTGLVVQTARVVAATPEDLTPLLAEVGKQLLMSDEEKVAYERERARQVKVLAPPAPPAPQDALPPPPDVPGAGQPLPPPIVIDHPLPPDFGGLRPGDFLRLPPAPPPGQPFVVPAVGGELEIGVKRRLVHIALNLGDNLFRRGRYEEAHRHFDLALQLAPGHRDIWVRLERVRPLLPPPPVVIVARPVIVVRPRVAILNFVVAGHPLVVPPYLSAWTPGHLAPYFSPGYDVVDPGEVYWYMAQMGMTLRDLMENPFARRWLGRALNVRYFVFGTIEQTASFDVSTYLVDAEHGFLQNSARMHVHNRGELKLRLGELAALTQMDPVVRARYLGEQPRFDGLLSQAERHIAGRDFLLAIKLYQDALRLRPNHVQVLAHLNLARQRADELAFQEARARALATEQARAAELQRRQWELAQAAERARIAAAQHAAAVDGRRLLEQQRLAAQAQVVNEARFYLKIGKFGLGISRFESALALAPTNDALVRELAVVRAAAERQAEIDAANAAAAREAARRQQQERELALARQKIEEEQARRLAAEEGPRKAKAQRDQAAYQAAFDEGRRLMSAGNYEGAIAALGAAARIRRTAEVETLLNQALVENARASAAAKGQAERLALEQQLAEDTTRRAKAEAEAKRNQELYAEALKSANQALSARNYAGARAKFEEAGKLFRTDAVLTGLRQVETAQTQHTAQAKAAQEKAIEQQQKGERVRQLLAQGQSALDAKQYSAALKSLRQAKALSPDNVDVRAALTKAEQAQQKAQTEARRIAEETERQTKFRRLLDSGKTNLANKQYDAAKLALAQALVLQPGDPEATAALQTVDKALSGGVLDAKAKAEAQRKATAYQKHMDDGRLALSTKRYDQAIKAFTSAQSILPGDKTSQNELQEAQKARTEAANAAALAVKKKIEEKQRATEVSKAIGDGRAALAAKNLDAAAKSFGSAAALAPKDPAVLRALEDLRQAQKTAQAEAETQQKRQAQYQTLLNAGKSALAAKKYDEAIKAFADARALVPDDRAGQDLLQQAHKAREDARLAGERAGQAKLQQERAGQLQKLINAGRASLKGNKLEDAAKALAEANRLAPNNPEVVRALQELDAARRSAQDQDTTRKQYQEAIRAGQQAVAAKKYDEAVKAFNEAARLMPGDRTAQDLSAQAQKAWTAAKTAQAEEQKRVVDFNRLMKDAGVALQAKRFADAQKAYSEALKIMPNDAGAQRGLQDATRGLEASRKTAPSSPPPAKNDPPKPSPPVKKDPPKKEAVKKDLPKGDPQTLYQRSMENGAALEKQKKFAEAMQAYEEALKHRPKDPKATQELRNAEFNHRLAEGEKHLQARRFADAIREFEAALRISPGNATATKLLNRAKQRKN